MLQESKLRREIIEAAVRLGPSVTVAGLSREVYLSRSGLYRHISGIAEARREACEHAWRLTNGHDRELGLADYLVGLGPGVNGYLALPANRWRLASRIAHEVGCSEGVAAAAAAGFVRTVRRARSLDVWGPDVTRAVQAVFSWASGEALEPPARVDRTPPILDAACAKDRLALAAISSVNSTGAGGMTAVIEVLGVGSSSVYRFASNEMELRILVEAYLVEMACVATSLVGAIGGFGLLLRDLPAVKAWIDWAPADESALERQLVCEFDRAAGGDAALAAAALFGAGCHWLARNSDPESAWPSMVAAFARGVRAAK